VRMVAEVSTVVETLNRRKKGRWGGVAGVVSRWQERMSDPGRITHARCVVWPADP
jgi:hypothetical protein